MKRYSTTTWAAGLVLAISIADCAGIYVAQVRLHRAVPASAPESAYAAATAVKDTWRGSGSAPQAQRAYANTVTYAAAAPSATAPVAPPLVPTMQRLAQADVKVPAYKPRTDTFLTPPRLAEATPPERVELATAVHAAQHRTALHRASARLAQRDSAPPTSLSFAAAFGGGGGGMGALALPEPTFGKQSDAGSVAVDPARATPSDTATESPRIDMADTVTIGKSAPASVDALDPELPAVALAVQSAAQPGN